MAVRAVGGSAEEFLDEMVSLDALYFSLATVDCPPTTSKGCSVLREGGKLLWSSVGKCFKHLTTAGGTIAWHGGGGERDRGKRERGRVGNEREEGEWGN